MKTYAEMFAILSFEGMQNALKKTANILSIYSVRLCICNNNYVIINWIFITCVVLTAQLLLTHSVL